ncbi:hypothetical protein A5663_07890 [Mycobacterium sp. E740]|nr:hypothetical protein A5663_07890 [Mycobacterium sp. E740]
MDVWLAAAERQRSHGDLVNLSAGQPSAGAPAAVRAAAREALDTTVLGYTVALGIPELRVAIAGAYLDRHGLHVDPNDVVITTGSSGGITVPVGLAGLATMTPRTGGSSSSSICTVGWKRVSGPQGISTTSQPSADKMFR